MFILSVFLCYIWWSSLISCMGNRRIGLGEPNFPESRNNVMEFEDKWFTQKLDHFNPTDNRTWKQVPTL